MTDADKRIAADLLFKRLLVKPDERRREHGGLPHLDLLGPGYALAHANRPNGVSGASTTAQEDSSGNLVFEDQGNLLLWVAGVPTSLANLPTTGTATYTGHAIANIASPSGGVMGTSYLAAGTFSAAVNFGARNGAITINGLDGANYAGTANWVPSTVTFNGTLAGNVGGRSAALAGSFFQGGASNSTPLYGEMGGSLNLTGTGGYLGSGIFAARKP